MNWSHGSMVLVGLSDSQLMKSVRLYMPALQSAVTRQDRFKRVAKTDYYFN